MGVVVKVSAEVDMPPQLYWELRNTPEFLEVECVVLNFKSKECVDLVRNDNGTLKSYRLLVQPSLPPLPQILLKQLSDSEGDIVFEDTVTFGANDYSFDFTSLSGIFADYTNVQGRGYLVVSKDGLSCTLHMEAIINVQLKFVGKLVESIVVNGIKDGYNKIPQVIDRFRELYPEKCSLSAIPAELASSYTSLAYHTPPQHTIHIQDSRSPPVRRKRPLQSNSSLHEHRRSMVSINYTRPEDDGFFDAEDELYDGDLIVNLEDDMPICDSYTYAETTSTQETRNVDKARQCTIITTKNTFTTVTTMIHAATHPPRPIKSHTQQLVPQTFMTDDEGLLIESSSGESEEGAPGKTQNTCKCAVEQPMGSPTYYIITFHINGDKHRLRERFSNIYNFYTALKKENLAILYRFEFAPKVWGAKKYSYPVIQHRKAKIAEFVTRLIDSDTCLTLPSVRTALGLV